MRNIILWYRYSADVRARFVRLIIITIVINYYYDNIAIICLGMCDLFFCFRFQSCAVSGPERSLQTLDGPVVKKTRKKHEKIRFADTFRYNTADTDVLKKKINK